MSLVLLCPLRPERNGEAENLKCCSSFTTGSGWRSEVPPAKRLKRNVRPTPPRFGRSMSATPKLLLECQAAQDADGEGEHCEAVKGMAQVIPAKLLKVWEDMISLKSMHSAEL
jgi:hypothetical protein